MESREQIDGRYRIAAEIRFARGSSLSSHDISYYGCLVGGGELTAYWLWRGTRDPIRSNREMGVEITLGNPLLSLVHSYSSIIGDLVMALCRATLSRVGASVLYINTCLLTLYVHQDDTIRIQGCLKSRECNR